MRAAGHANASAASMIIKGSTTETMTSRRQGGCFASGFGMTRTSENRMIVLFQLPVSRQSGRMSRRTFVFYRRSLPHPVRLGGQR
jgi:hypothetical protein